MLQQNTSPRVRLVLALGFCLAFGFRASAQDAQVVINVDAAAGHRPINPQIYGVAYRAATLFAAKMAYREYGPASSVRR